MRTPVLVSTLLLVACGGGGKGGDPTTVLLDTSGPPQLVAIKLGTGEWQAVEVSGTHYEIEVDEPYVVAVTCNDFTGLFDTYMFARTLGDDPKLSAPCTGEPLIDSSLQGTLVQAGQVAIGFASQPVSSPNGSFEIEASAGTHEVIAITDSAIAIRRDVEVAGVTQLPTPLDVDQEGAPLVPATFTVTNAEPNETPNGIVQLFTEHNTNVFTFGEAATVQLVPDEILVETDVQIVDISGLHDDGRGRRSVSFENVREDVPRTLELPEYLDDVVLDDTGGEIAAQWGDLPDHDVLRLQADQMVNAGFIYADLELTPAYADEMGERIALDFTIPNFTRDNFIDLQVPYNRSFSVTKRFDGFVASSSVAESSDRPQPAKRMLPAGKQRALARLK